jgi:hypothetical protein
MAYITGEENNCIIWVCTESVRGTEEAYNRFKELGYTNVCMWAVKPNWENPYFVKSYDNEKPLIQFGE